jgi:alpha-N-arabinofuranosidase
MAKRPCGYTNADARLDFAGAKEIAAKATAFTLTSGSVRDENSFAEPGKVVPQETSVKVAAPQFRYTFPANSLTVLRLKTKN